MKDTTDTVCQCNSSEVAHRISWNFVVLKDIMCTFVDMNFYRKCWFDPIKEQCWSLLNSGHNYFVQLVFCPIALQLCLELPLVVYSILKQCLSVGYVSLLTLSFIFISTIWNFKNILSSQVLAIPTTSHVQRSFFLVMHWVHVWIYMYMYVYRMDATLWSGHLRGKFYCFANTVKFLAMF